MIGVWLEGRDGEAGVGLAVDMDLVCVLVNTFHSQSEGVTKKKKKLLNVRDSVQDSTSYSFHRPRLQKLSFLTETISLNSHEKIRKICFCHRNIFL